jgi:thiol-disulfide isomerase/thioredoxin
MMDAGPAAKRPPHIWLEEEFELPSDMTRLAVFQEMDPMKDKKPTLFPSTKLVAIAALAGLVAGGIAVYMKEAGNGNGASAAAASQCAPAKAVAARLQPLAKGQVAAFIPANDPTPLSLPVLKDEAGKDISIDGYRPKVQLVNLWATWCVPCREEMPALNGLQKSMGGDRFQVTTINLDNGDAAKPLAFLKENNIDALPLHHDASLSSFNALKKLGVAMGLPATVLIDGQGCMLGAMNGPAAWDSDDAKALIKGALGEGA